MSTMRNVLLYPTNRTYTESVLRNDFITKMKSETADNINMYN
jgi:hypothetical protein